MAMTKARLALLARLAKHGTQFEREVCSRMLANRLLEAGYITRCAGSGRGKLTTITITDKGLERAKYAELGVLNQCTCYQCSKVML